MLRLPDVTLVAVDTVAHRLTALAVEECLRRVEFGAAYVFSDDDCMLVDGARLVTIAPMDGPGAWRFFWGKVPDFIHTSHVLVVQWDSWIINPSAWTSEFLQYDYIGAPWWYGDECNVGNGGFSLRSLRLMDLLRDNAGEFPIEHPEDDVICRKYGLRLKALGFKFAPVELARRFSVERSMRWLAPFGFHGMFNWPLVLTDEQIEARLAVTPPYVLEHDHCAQMREVMEACWAGVPHLAAMCGGG